MRIVVTSRLWYKNHTKDNDDSGNNKVYCIKYTKVNEDSVTIKSMV